MKVIARKGLRVPMENGRRRYVTDAVSVEVQCTAYYRRRVIDGDLITHAAQIAKQEAEARGSAASALPATKLAAGSAGTADARVSVPGDAGSDKKNANGA